MRVRMHGWIDRFGRKEYATTRRRRVAEEKSERDNRRSKRAIGRLQQALPNRTTRGKSAACRSESDWSETRNGTNQRFVVCWLGWAGWALGDGAVWRRAASASGRDFPRQPAIIIYPAWSVVKAKSPLRSQKPQGTQANEQETGRLFRIS